MDISWYSVYSIENWKRQKDIGLCNRPSQFTKIVPFWAKLPSSLCPSNCTLHAINTIGGTARPIDAEFYLGILVEGTKPLSETQNVNIAWPLLPLFCPLVTVPVGKMYVHIDNKDLVGSTNKHYTVCNFFLALQVSVQTGEDNSERSPWVWHCLQKMNSYSTLSHRHSRGGMCSMNTSCFCFFFVCL